MKTAGSMTFFLGKAAVRRERHCIERFKLSFHTGVPINTCISVWRAIIVCVHKLSSPLPFSTENSRLIMVISH